MPDFEIPGFRLGQVLGRGGFATVYLAEQPSLGRRVAVKVLDIRLGDDVQRLRFEREARAAGSLAHHPNIIPTYDSGVTSNGLAYLVMAYMRRGTLADLVAEQGPLPWDVAVGHVVKVAGALETAHRAGVLHRDVKPENILVDDAGAPRLADFGIASVVGGFQTQSAKVSLSLAHAAPEVISGKRATLRSDVYSLASSLYSLLAGRPAFAGSDDESLVPMIARIATNPPPQIDSRPVPAPIFDSLLVAMAKDPDDRYGSALELADALCGAARESGVELSAPNVIEIDTGIEPMSEVQLQSLAEQTRHHVFVAPLAPPQKHQPLLDMLDDQLRQQFIAAATRRRYRKGDSLFHAGDLGDTLHVIVKGHVAVRIDTTLGDVSTLAILGPGSSLGEQVFLVPDARRTASAVALDAVESLALRREDFDALRQRNPGIDRLLVFILAEQVRRLSAQVVDARHFSVPVRAARVIRDLMQSWGGPKEGLEIPLTQDDLASLAGVTRPTMNRALQDLVDRGALELGRGKLTVLDPKLITARAR